MKNYEFFSGPGICGKREVALIDMETHIRVITGVFDAVYGILEIDGEPPMSGVLVRDVEDELLKALGRKLMKNYVVGAVPEPDMVNSPPHYQLLPGVEVYDVRMALLAKMEGVSPDRVDDWSRAWEYLTRMWQKNGLEDAKKCRWYLDKLIEKMS